MDSSVVPSKRFPGMLQVSTTDFFYPSVDDPYMEGKIACANVLSDLYAMGLRYCDNMLMILGVSRLMSAAEQHAVTTELIRGFNDQATIAKTKVTGGQTVMNPWPMCGGIAMSIAATSDIVMPEGAEVGDVCVLTKPLGTQVISNVHVWAVSQCEQWDKISHVISIDEAEAAYQCAMHSMARLNRAGAKLMHRHGAHCCTDITGFGLLGHADNLAQNQTNEVSIEIHTLPIIRKMKEVSQVMPIFKLMEGRSAETSGGLFVCLPAERAAAFCAELERLDGKPAWIVGRVVAGNRRATVCPDAAVIEVL